MFASDRCRRQAAADYRISGGLPPQIALRTDERMKRFVEKGCFESTILLFLMN